MSQDKGLKKFFESDKPLKISLPKGLVGDRGKISKEEFWQIYRELTKLALLNQSPFLSLNADPETLMTEINVDLPPALKNTLVGHTLIESDYLMKSISHFPISYIPEEKRETFLEHWKTLPNNVKDFVQGDENIATMRAYFQQRGALLFGDSQSVATGLLAYDKLGRDEQISLMNNKRYPNAELFKRIYPTDPRIIYNNKGEITCTSRYAVTTGWYFDSKDGRRQHIDPNAATAKQLEKSFRENLLPPAKKIMAYMDLIYMLYPIVRSMVECGNLPDFSSAPDYKAYHTADRLPPILNVQQETYARAYGGVSYGRLGQDNVVPAVKCIICR